MFGTDNPRQLVLRRDTATGLTLVGLESELPIGRFKHLTLVCELEDNRLPALDNPYYAEYQAACLRAREANRLVLDAQIQQHNKSGWFAVPLSLSPHDPPLQADEFGNYFNAAMKLLFQLTHNNKQAWAVIQADRIVHIRSRQPPTDYDELSYQVWYHQQLHQLDQINGEIQQGSLLVCESGLWFIPQA